MLVHLLDGAVTSNTSGLGPSGGSCVSLVSACDPNGIHASTNGNGTVTVITEDSVTNLGAGDGILAESENGDTVVTTEAAVNNTLGDGIHAIAHGTGNATVNLGNVTANYSVATTVGDGVRAESSLGNAAVVITAPGSVTVTDGDS